MLYRADRLVTTAGVAAVDGRFFLAQRKPGGALSRRWEFPGGKCDQSDADEARCLVREFQEEFGVGITVGAEIGAVPFVHRSIPYILVAYWITFETPPQRLYEHLDSGWFTRDQMLALDLADSDRLLIETHLSE